MNKLNDKGLREGLWREYYDDGQLNVDCNYIDGKLNGLYKDYYDNNQLCQECSYINGLVNGLYTQYYINGQLRIKGHYLMDNEVYVWVTFDKLGQLVSKEYYDNN